MNKNTKIVLIISLVILLGVLSFVIYLILSKRKQTANSELILSNTNTSTNTVKSSITQSTGTSVDTNTSANTQTNTNENNISLGESYAPDTTSSDIVTTDNTSKQETSWFNDILNWFDNTPVNGGSSGWF